MRGEFEIEGKPEMPVIFTSINDSMYNRAAAQNADAFDWNGITIEAGARKIEMSDFILSYSVYGIKSKEVDIIIKRGIFKQNGQFDVTIDDKIQDVKSKPFNYRFSDSVQKQQHDTRRWMKPVGAGSIAVGSALLGVMGYFIYSTKHFERQYNDADDNRTANQCAAKRDVEAKKAIITGITGGIFIASGAGLLFLCNQTDKIKVVLTPVLLERYGLNLTMQF